jgi:regulator of protease activity HflC (stomatin/prohibitin superfamily)
MASRSTPTSTRSVKPGLVAGGVVAALLFTMLLLSGSFTRVDSTEHCVLTRYGTVIKRKMPTGLNFTPLAEPTCFGMTQKNFPDNAEGKEEIQATTADPVTVEGDVAVTWSYNPGSIHQVFLDKRTPEAAETEVLNAVREGYRNALNAWTVNRIFSAERARLSDDVRKAIQAKLGTAPPFTRCSCATSASRRRSSRRASRRPGRRRCWTARRSSSPSTA